MQEQKAENTERRESTQEKRRNEWRGRATLAKRFISSKVGAYANRDGLRTAQIRKNACGIRFTMTTCRHSVARRHRRTVSRTDRHTKGHCDDFLSRVADLIAHAKCLRALARIAKLSQAKSSRAEPSRVARDYDFKERVTHMRVIYYRIKVGTRVLQARGLMSDIRFSYHGIL